MNDDLIFYKLHGLNFNKLLKTLNNKNIEIFNLKVLENNNFSLEIKKKNKLEFLHILKSFNILVVDYKPQSFFLKTNEYLIKRLAYAVCLIIVFIGVAISNFFVFKIEIYGLDRVERTEVEKVLGENNFRVGKLKTSYKLENIESLLKNKFEKISLASCSIVGNTLIVNVLEKKYEVNKEHEAILAPYDMIINKIDLRSGTSVARVGQTIKQGEEIVVPLIYDSNGKSFSVKASAKVFAYAEKTISNIYFENHTKEVRSGRFEVVNNTNKYKGKFIKYQLEVKERYLFKNFILPIKQRCYIYHETIDKNVFEPFNKAIEEKIIEENEKLLYNAFDGCESAENKTLVSFVEKVENYYVISTTISANIIF